MTSMMRTAALTVALAALATASAAAQTTSRTLTPRVQLLPDVAVTAVQVRSSLGSRGCIGSRNTVIVTLTNKGYLTRSSFPVHLGHLEETGLVMPTYGSKTVSGLEGGASVQLIYTGVTGISGTFPPVLIDADPLRRIGDSDYTNNRSTGARLTGLTEPCVRPTRR